MPIQSKQKKDKLTKAEKTALRQKLNQKFGISSSALAQLISDNDSATDLADVGQKLRELLRQAPRA
jgi:uncharacterized tellurite resistance protein B-like protein